MYESTLIIRQLGLQAWKPVNLAMRQFTDQRNDTTYDEIWLVEHKPIFTQGHSGKIEHLLIHSNIPVMQSDRGGQITYHGPGQQIMYILINLRRRQIGIRQLVSALEHTVIDTLEELSISANARLDARGVYVNNKKICSIGLRIRNNCSLHGLALNVAMDLKPFLKINPCGHIGLEMTQLKFFIPSITLVDIQPLLIKYFAKYLLIQDIQWKTDHFILSKK